MFYCCTPQCGPGCTDPRHRWDPWQGQRNAAGERREGVAGTASARLRKEDPFAKLTRPARVVRDRAGHPKRVDLHCHYLNPAIAAKVAEMQPNRRDASWVFASELSREVNARQGQERRPQLTDIHRRLVDMDKMGIDVQAVSPAPPQYYYWAEPGLGQELARGVNEGIAQIVADHPNRFVGLGTVPLQDADLAVAELDYAVRKLGLRGIEINTNVNGKNLTDPELGLDKFFRRIQQLDVVLFLHPSGFTEAARLVGHYFNNIIGNPMDTTIAVSHLIFDGVMERNPKLKVVLAHSGGYIGHYWARMDHGHKARSDARTVIKKAPTRYLERFYFDTICFDADMLAHSIRKWGADHVVLGTDYPYDMGMYDPLGFVDSVKGLAQADRDLVKGGNAARLLKIKAK